MSDTHLHFLRFVELGGALETLSDLAWRGLFASYVLGFAFAARSPWRVA